MGKPKRRPGRSAANKRAHAADPIPVPATQDESALSTAQKTRLEIDKLREEIAALKRSEFSRPTFWITSVTALVSLLAFVAQTFLSSAKIDEARSDLKLEQTKFINEQHDWKESEDRRQDKMDKLNKEVDNLKDRVKKGQDDTRAAKEQLDGIEKRISAVLARLTIRPIAPYVITNRAKNRIWVTVDTNREGRPLAIDPGQSELFVAPQVFDYPLFHMFPPDARGDADVRVQIARHPPLRMVIRGGNLTWTGEEFAEKDTGAAANITWLPRLLSR